MDGNIDALQCGASLSRTDRIVAAVRSSSGAATCALLAMMLCGACLLFMIDRGRCTRLPHSRVCTWFAWLLLGLQLVWWCMVGALGQAELPLPANTLAVALGLSSAGRAIVLLFVVYPSRWPCSSTKRRTIMEWMINETAWMDEGAGNEYDSSVCGTTEFNMDWKLRMQRHDYAHSDHLAKTARDPMHQDSRDVPPPPSGLRLQGTRLLPYDDNDTAQQRPSLHSSGHSENCLNLQPRRQSSASDGGNQHPQRTRGRSLDAPTLRSVGSERKANKKKSLGALHLSKMLTIHSNETSTSESSSCRGSMQRPASGAQEASAAETGSHEAVHNKAGTPLRHPFDGHTGGDSAAVGSTSNSVGRGETAAVASNSLPRAPAAPMQPSATYGSYPSTRQASHFHLGLQSSSRSNSTASSLPTRGGSAVGTQTVASGDSTRGGYRSRNASSFEGAASDVSGMGGRRPVSPTSVALYDPRPTLACYVDDTAS